MKYGRVFNSFNALYNAMTLPSGGATVVTQDKQVQKAKKTNNAQKAVSSIPGYMAATERRKKGDL